MLVSLSQKLAALSASKPGGWLGVEDVRAATAFPLEVISDGSILDKILEINPKLGLARVLNLKKDGRIKVDWARNEVSSRIVRLKNPEYHTL